MDWNRSTDRISGCAPGPRLSERRLIRVRGFGHHSKGVSGLSPWPMRSVERVERVERVAWPQNPVTPYGLGWDELTSKLTSRD
eukprot:TCALIF_03358-PA protein Name:"Protein of unknown function" AED:0.65 eAED:1.00 QI:0/0/0/1/0/0/2/0/82